MDQDTARQIADAALDLAEHLGASYADVRFYLQDRDESIVMKNDIVEDIGNGSDSGAGVRVLKNGAWGFSSFSDLTRGFSRCGRDLMRTVREAVTLAEASARLRSFPLELAPILSVSAGSDIEHIDGADPFTIPMGDRVELLRQLGKALGENDSRLIVRSAAMEASRFTKFFASTEHGTANRCYLAQTVNWLSFSLGAIAHGDDETQERSGEFCFTQGILPGMVELLVEAAERFGREAIELLSASECEPGVTDVIITPPQLGLHIHETGHGFEGDRLLRYEQTYIGETFGNDIISDIGSYQFGSEAVSIVADATAPGGYGTFAFDDEGVPGQRFFLVENGVFRNVLTSRETVSQINRRIGCDYYEESNGTARASSYDRIPLIRMTNISLVPGEGSLQDLVARVEHGILLDGIASWSMSEDRRNFDFGTQLGREIRNGKLGRIIRNPGYTGNNLQFWKSCEAVAGSEEEFLLNVPNCGKGLPGQEQATGHASSPALFRGVHVFNRKQRGGE